MNINLKKLIDFWIGGPAVTILFPFVRLAGLAAKRDHSLTNVKSVAILKLLGGGSLALALPTFVALKRNHPGMKLSVVCSRSIAPFAHALKIFDEVRVIDDRSVFSLVTSSLQTLLWLFRNVQVTIDLEIHSRLSTVFTTISFVQTRIGLIDHHSLWRKRLYTHAIFLNPSGANYEGYDAIVGLFGSTVSEFAMVQNHWQGCVVDVPDAVSKKLPVEPFYVLGAGCSDLSRERQLSVDQWIKLIDALHETQPNRAMVFLGNSNDSLLASDIIKRVRAANLLYNFCGSTPLDQSIAIIKKAQAFIGIDSALIHFARWNRVKVLGFWGPTNPRTLLRPMPIVERHLYLAKSCSPCVHLTSEPPCRGRNFCMDFDDRFREAAAWLKNEDANSRGISSWNLSSQAITFFPDQQSRVVRLDWK